MVTLERITQMKATGLSESQIINLLKQEGVTPKEINDALNQAKIKDELSQIPPGEEPDQMRPSIMQPKEPIPEPVQEQPLAEAQEGNYQEQNYDYPAYEAPQQQQQQQEQQPEYYPQYQEYQAPSQNADIDTISEITDQIVEEKIADLKKQISTLKNFKEETKADLDRLNLKIDKLDNNLNELQIAIIRKIGEYGENIKNISKEMHETQNSFSKIV